MGFNSGFKGLIHSYERGNVSCATLYALVCHTTENRPLWSSCILVGKCGLLL